MKIAVTQFVTLDGVSQGPGSVDEDTTGDFDRGGWFVPYLDEEFVQQASQWLDLAGGLLLGRRTYAAFARDWPQISEPDPFTVRMNTLPKYVVSNTLPEGHWNPTTVLRGDPLVSVRALKQQPGGELQIHGSSRLASALLAAGLVDTLRLAVAPAVVGRGRRLLAHPDADIGLRLIEHGATSSGLVILVYEAAGPAQRSEYAGAPPIN
ncbi:dihydrofolate reductase family protein [Ruania halotolerans]|uniref:dihydrofolate reductase family protein n=1 Tax=Ruania halotolerans TaxID=2897773 RepID=UPI001E34E255|nr:dihydrofolate reductase family protein [Ruania halotolerans]UFU05419.1 dihydrofolate reductase family protein [Ruania halotolerans]